MRCTHYKEARADRSARAAAIGQDSDAGIPVLEEEIDRLQRTEETIVVATRATRERGCPPWVVLGVKAVEASSVRAA